MASGTDGRHDQDFFEDVLNLEDQYYNEGYDLGVSDGSRAGRIEGRTFGLEKGFEKFAEMGRMNGRVSVWKSRLPIPSSDASSKSTSTIPSLSGSDRLKKHVDRLAALTEAGTMPTENSEQSVADFDDRLRDAKSKMKLVAKMVGEDEHVKAVDSSQSGNANAGSSTGTSGEMEDFTGLPAIRRGG